MRRIPLVFLLIILAKKKRLYLLLLDPEIMTNIVSGSAPIAAAYLGRDRLPVEPLYFCACSIKEDTDMA